MRLWKLVSYFFRWPCQDYGRRRSHFGSTKIRHVCGVESLVLRRKAVSKSDTSLWMNEWICREWAHSIASQLLAGWFFLAPTSILQVQEESIFLQYTSLLPWQSTTTMLVSYLASSGLGSPRSSTVGAHPTEPPLSCRRHGCPSSTCGPLPPAGGHCARARPPDTIADRAYPNIDRTQACPLIAVELTIYILLPNLH